MQNLVDACPRKTDGFTVWTAERLRDHREKETGIRLNIGRLTMLLAREDYVYRRPKQDLTVKQNQTAKQQAAELLDELKRGRSEPMLSFLIERFWKYLKHTAWANKLYTPIDALRTNVTDVLRLQNDPTSSQRLTVAKVFR